MGGKFDIYIFEVGDEYRVRPAVAMTEGSSGSGGAGAIKSLKFRNLTAYPVVLAFPNNFVQGGQDALTLNSKATASVNLAPGLDGYYPYAVMINKNGELVPAQGESAPAVIVDP